MKPYSKPAQLRKIEGRNWSI